VIRPSDFVLSKLIPRTAQTGLFLSSGIALASAGPVGALVRDLTMNSNGSGLSCTESARIHPDGLYHWSGCVTVLPPNEKLSH
jgi:hypothetical protein